jgi:hypothetical protein
MKLLYAVPDYQYFCHCEPALAGAAIQSDKRSLDRFVALTRASR